MKKNYKDKSSQNKDITKQDPPALTEKIKQGGVNSTFPQEYEEQLNTNIRMKPQPLVTPKKSGV